jgi:very-short-patch-repair endonuclease
MSDDSALGSCYPDASGNATTLPACVGLSVTGLIRRSRAFVTVARPIPPEVEGANRARSASEAFLYRRLETLPETRGRFRRNADLPIGFDGLGRMEIDLLCENSRVVVEIDGAQHLADPVAYRRDRRKDQLLQEKGYLVLRYLAEDLAKELDSVLDGIPRGQFPAEIACGDEYGHLLAREPCKVNC